MKTDTSALADPPRRTDQTTQSIWFWRMSGQIGRWLPDALLAGLNGGQPAVEPFAETGEHAALAKGWRKDIPREADEKRLRSYLGNVGGLVHSVDRWPDNFHAAITDAGAQRSGRNVIVFIRDSTTRLADQFGPVQKSALIENLIEQDREAAARLGSVQLALSGAKQPVHWLALDELAADESRQGSAWREFRAFIGEAAANPGAESAWQARLAGEIKSLVAALDPRWLELLQREALWAGSPDLAPACLKPVERLASGPGAASARLVRFDRMPSVLREGDSVRLSGVVVTAGATQPDRRLFLRQGDHRQRLGWDQPSPAVAAKMPDEPSAAQARFKPVAIRVSRRQPATMLYRADEKAVPVQLAEIAFEPVGREAIEGIFLAPWSIGYQPIPKVACTSIKEVFFRAATGLPFSPALAEGANHVHRYFDLRMRDVSAAGFRFVVVRDPIKRLLSAFSNRVLHHKELSRNYVERLNLNPALELESFAFDPSLAQFVERFQTYRQIPTIDHHFRPISEFSAPLKAFDKVYPFEALDDLVADLQQRTGVQMSLPHSQRGGPKLQVKDLPPKVFDKLVDIFAADYAMLDGLYSPAALR